MPKENILITNKINNHQKKQVAKLYYRSFRKKFAHLWLFFKDEDQAIGVLVESIRYENGLYALQGNKVLGFIGLERGNNAFLSPRFSTLLKTFNFPQSFWRFFAYKMYRISKAGLNHNAIHIDPIAVHSASRGKGVGTKLLNATFKLAKKLDAERIILEVVDTNPKAQKLYENLGFQVIKEQNTKFLTQRVGFQKVFYMEKKLRTCKYHKL